MPDLAPTSTSRIPARQPNLPAPTPLPKPAAPVRRPLRTDDSMNWSPAVKAARKNAEAAWTYPGPAEVSDSSFQRVEKDARDANAKPIFDHMNDAAAARARNLPAPAPNAPDRDQVAAKLLQANQRLADQALANWDSIRELRYMQVQELIADDPMASLAWQTLLVTGKLDANAEPAHDGKPLLEQITALMNQRLVPGLDRKSLIADLIQEVAEPNCIAQHARSTCTVTSTEIMLVGDRPAEYVRLVAGLAGPGAVATVGGAVLSRVECDPAKSGRTQSSALFQAACMDLGNGAFVYNDDNDQSGPDGSVIGPSRGLGPDELATVLDALTGGHWSYQAANTTAQGGLMALGNQKNTVPPEEALASVERITGKNRPVVVGMTWADDLADKRAVLSGHAILVTGSHDGRVYYNNPHGAQESMSEADFKSRVRGFHREATDG